MPRLASGGRRDGNFRRSPVVFCLAHLPLLEKNTIPSSRRPPKALFFKSFSTPQFSQRLVIASAVAQPGQRAGEVEEERSSQVYPVICLESMSWTDVLVSRLVRRAPASAVLWPGAAGLRTDHHCGLGPTPISLLPPGSLQNYLTLLSRVWLSSVGNE